MPEPGDPQALNRYSYSNNNSLRYVDPSGHESCEPGDNACWESRWYRAHGYELGDHGWRYSGQYYFGDADAFAEFLADVANGDHGVAVGSSFHANVGPVTLSLQPAGQDTELSNVLGIVGVGMDVADFGITASFAALYTVDLVSSISSGPGFAAGLAAGQVGYMSIQGPLAVIDGIGLGAVFFADVSAGRTQVGPDQVAVGGDMLVSLWSITVSNLSPVVFPGTYLGLTGDSCQLAYDFVRATGRLPGYSLIVNWGATR